MPAREVQNAQSIEQILPSEYIRHRLGRPPSVQQDCTIADLRAFSGVIEHRQADQVITVGAGISVDQLNDTLREFKQWLPVGAPRKEFTLADCILSGDAGYLEHMTLGARRLALGLGLMIDSNEPVQFGGRVVKNVTGYDITKLITGSFGAFGIPASVSLRLYALPDLAKTLLCCSDDLTELTSFATKLMRIGLPFSAIEILGKATGRLLNLPERHAILIQSVGQLAQVEAILSQAISVATAMSLAPELLDEEKSKYIWQKLASLAWQEGLHYLDVTASANFLSEAGRKQDHTSFFEYRPGVGRLRFFSPSIEQLAKLAENLATASDEAMMISYPVPEGKLRLANINCGSEVPEFFRKTKAVFDPQNKFNPFILV